VAANDLPQTVGEDYGWLWLMVRCIYCHHEARIMLADHGRSNRLASIITRVRCTRCPDLPPQVDVKIGFETHATHEKPIGVAGDRIYKIGMM